MQKASLNQIKLLRKLGQKKYREHERLFLVEGERAVEQVLENKLIEVHSVFIEETKADSYQLTADNFLLKKQIFNEISDTETPQGVIAVCRMPDETDPETLKNRTGVLIATDAIQDPGNLGTIIRTASWFGCKALLAGKGTVDIFNPKVVRSTAGATGSLEYCTGDLADLLKPLENSGWQVLLLDGNPGAEVISEINKTERIIIVIGNEANGISPKLLTAGRKRVMIPSYSDQKQVESLNAAIAAGIALWSVHN